MEALELSRSDTKIAWVESKTDEATVFDDYIVFNTTLQRIANGPEGEDIYCQIYDRASHGRWS